MTTNNQHEHQSVIAFYEINYDIANMNYKEVWDKYVGKKLAGVSCTNIVYCYDSPHALSEILYYGYESGELDAILKIAQNEFESGSNYMFVVPTKGEPIDGYNIKEFIHSFV